MPKHHDDNKTCECSHKGYNHSDVNLMALGKCYRCPCQRFRRGA